MNRYINTQPYTVGQYLFGRDPKNSDSWVVHEENKEIGRFPAGWRARQFCQLLSGGSRYVVRS